ncbi:MAG: hypothetical protein D6758_07070 [Gammaproteobacteria bacterium]|nr:MAG: hypothetical protein D6758_07070 [Gammaproteobacteria bacterium]
MTVKIDVFVDVLCVWAWVSGIRVREVHQTFGDQVAIDWHVLNLFGCTEKRIGQGWADKGSYEGFGRHVHHVCESFDHVTPSKCIWQEVRPCSSLPAHLWLKAAEHVARQSGQPVCTGDWLAAVQEAFFAQGQDISQEAVLVEVFTGLRLDESALRAALATGEPGAAVARDLALAEEYRLRGSPSYVLNEGRQVLFGNVGYRIIEANIQEILNRPGDIASWC